MGETRDRVAAAVGAAYQLERELGGGGMSHVFLAEEQALGRRVVIKVLSSELTATVSAERFRREIQVAARLQHPHIVPLFASGEGGDGLLFYTMPYIEGESLRSRIARSGELPVPEAVGIVSDIVDAIGYAHARGVVHRDLKPENVLLSDGHAVVTDFGVAKALSDAVVADTLTSAGLALGTPAYMAPEQAAGDVVDHRADLYAIGVIAYELLTGQAPFTGRSAQQIMAAHATAAPEPLERRRASVPPALADLVMRLLEKRPADRPQNAADVRRELQAVVTPQGGTVTFAPAGRSRVSRRALAIGGAVVAAAVATGVMLRPRATRPADQNVIAIAPFRVAGADASLGYLREGMVDLLASVFTGEDSTARAADPRSLMSAWRRAAGAENADPSQDVALRVAERLGAGQLLLGSVVGNASQLTLSASLIAVPSGRSITTAKVEGHPDSLARLVDRLAAQLIVRQAGAADAVGALTNVPIRALRDFLSGQSAYRRGRYEDAVRSFERALEPDSTFAAAALALTVAANWGGTGEQIDRGGRLAWGSRERLSARDRAYLELFWGPGYPEPATPSELIVAGEHAIEVSPDNPEVWYEYGDALYHLGPTIGVAAAHDQGGPRIPTGDRARLDVRCATRASDRPRRVAG